MNKEWTKARALAKAIPYRRYKKAAIRKTLDAIKQALSSN